MSTPRFTIEVEWQVLATQKAVLVVTDQQDMLNQLAAHDAQIRSTALVTKAKRDKHGKYEFHELSKDWDLP
jgi:hypothetical protein